MVQQLNDPYSGNIFGRLGAGVGKGLSEQLPKEVERFRLSQGLRDLRGLEGKSPMEQLAGIYSVPGITPEIANQAQQYLRQQAQIQEAQQQVQPRTMGPQPSRVPVQEAVVPQEPQRLRSTPQAIREGALQYISAFPQRFRTMEDAEAQYKKDVATQEAQINAIGNRFTEVGSQLLQKGGKETYADVLGELQREFTKRAENAVLRGEMSETEAADKYTKQMLDFAKARNRQKVQGPSRWAALFSGNPQQQLKAAQKAYKDADLPEAFMNDLVTYQKLSLPRAAAIAFPTQTKAKKALEEVKKPHRIGVSDTAVFDKVLDSISADDSLQNIAFELQKKGYSPQGFLKHAIESDRDLNQRQIRELQSIGSFEPSLSDILYYTLIGKGG